MNKKNLIWILIFVSFLIGINTINNFNHSHIEKVELLSVTSVNGGGGSFDSGKTCEENDGIIILNQKSPCSSITTYNAKNLDGSYQSCLIETFWDCSARNYCSDEFGNDFWVFLEGSQIILKNETEKSGFNCNEIFSSEQCNRLRCIFESTPSSESISVPSTYLGTFQSVFNTNWESFDSGRQIVLEKCSNNGNDLEVSECKDKLKDLYSENPILEDCLEVQDNSRFRDRYCRGVSSALTDLRTTTGLRTLFDNDRYDFDFDRVEEISNFIHGFGYDEEAIKGWHIIFGYLVDDDNLISGLLSQVNILKEPLSRWNDMVSEWTSPIKKNLIELCESSWETPFDSTYGSDLIALNYEMSKDSYLDYSGMKYHLLDSIGDTDLIFYYYVEFEFGNFENNVSYGLCLGNDDNINQWDDCNGRKIGRYVEDDDKYVMRNLTKRDTISSFNIDPNFFVFNNTEDFDYISVCFDYDFNWMDNNCISRKLLDYTDKENIPNYEILHDDSDSDDNGEEDTDDNGDESDEDVGGRW